MIVTVIFINIIIIIIAVAVIIRLGRIFQTFGGINQTWWYYADNSTFQTLSSQFVNITTCHY